VVINGRYLAVDPPDWALHPVNADRAGRALVQADGQLVLAVLPAAKANALIGSWNIADVPGLRLDRLDLNVLIDRPWHILGRLEATIARDLASFSTLPSWRARRSAPGVYKVGKYQVRVHPGARVYPGTVFMAEEGAIVLDADTVVGANSTIEGPFYLGPRSLLAPHSCIRPAVAIGPRCKAAGEISHTVIQGWSNKAHLGYLGHSLLGEWVNLGADTTVSNLKTTYGSVRVQLHASGPAEDSEQMFQGPVIGDYTRTAIGTCILTGACLATGTMLALHGFPPKCTRTLGFYTEARPQGVPQDMEKFLQAARLMMGRRQRELTPALETRLRRLPSIHRADWVAPLDSRVSGEVA
jgi:UDP-N-acetylglucosamine diphosphorylase / glucose-1-phosphate thymidylyltransferase / UDP-N-acetylgalactosamine diphosphorylase / glucosamine-1-phosphate N-acetyltransferase / galactosamine-1-phosphate N-acetyltransferase